MELTGLQKVHIVPVGYEYERIIKPLEKIHADKVLLVVDNKDLLENGNARRFYEDSKKEIETKVTKDVETIQCELWNLTDILNKLSTRICQEKTKKNMVFVNVSSGNKLFSVGATIAGMMYGAYLYYARAEKPSQYNPNRDKKGNIQAFSKGPYILDEVPPFTIKPPKDVLIKALSIVEKTPGIKQYDLIVELEKLGVLSNIFESQEGKTLKRKASITKNTYGLFKRTILKKLEEKKWIECEETGKKMKVKITEEGKSTLDVFKTIVLDT